MPGADPSDLTSVPLFDSLSDSELADVAASFEVKEVGGGVRLVGEGTGYSFFVICAGEAAVTADGDEITTLRAGEFSAAGSARDGATHRDCDDDEAVPGARAVQE